MNFVLDNRQSDEDTGRNSLKLPASQSHNQFGITSFLREMITRNPVAAIAVGVGLGGMLKLTMPPT